MVMKNLICTKSAAPLLGIAPSTLENWRVRGDGPAFHKMPGKKGRVLYDPDDIAAWRESCRFFSTAAVSSKQGPAFASDRLINQR
jgi:hypothetical protein